MFDFLRAFPLPVTVFDVAFFFFVFFFVAVVALLSFAVRFLVVEPLTLDLRGERDL
jgi:hypothetical protein